MKSTFQNWSDVRVFLAVQRAGSTLAASKDLGMAQPTVARRIEALEHTLGVTLFERNTRGFQPTSEARELIAVAEQLEDAAGQISKTAASLRNKTSRIIRITGPDSVFAAQFSAILEEFIEDYGDVQFEFIRQYDVVDLASGEADIALRFANQIEDQSLICRKITDIKGSMVASKNYVAKYGCPQSPDEFSAHRFIAYSGRNIPHAFNNWLLDRIDADQVVMTCKDIETLESAVEMGAGIGPVPTCHLKSKTNLVACFALPPEINITSWLLAGPSAYRRPEVRAFTAFFAPRFSALFREE